MVVSSELQSRAEMAHYKMSKGVFISEIREREDAVFVSDDIVKDFFWNYAGLIDTEEPEKLLEKIENFFSSKDRAPAAYVTSETEPEDLDELLEEKGFEQMAQDVWMFYKGGGGEALERLDSKIVETEEEIPEFLELFGIVYGGAEDEPYGEMPDYYQDALERSFEGGTDTDDIRDFIFYREEEAVGIGTLNFEDEFAGIYSVGVIPSERGKGVGSEIVNFLVKEARESGVDQIFLQTEKGSSNEDFFEKNGFETEFEGKIMVKTDG